MSSEELIRKLLWGSYHRAKDYLSSLDTVGSEWVVEVDDVTARLGMKEGTPVIHMPVTKFEPVNTVPAPQIYDFITGIEQMDSGGPLPDWSDCGRAMPFRDGLSSNPLRHKYLAKFAERCRIDVLVNPSNRELYLYPEAKLYFTYQQSWHKKVRDQWVGQGREEVDTIESEMCLLSFDTYEEGFRPRNWFMMVPHPQFFRETYEEGDCVWDGSIVTYSWTSNHSHRVQLEPSTHQYYSTQGVDKLLSQEGRAFWLYWGGATLLEKALYEGDDFRVSFNYMVKEQQEFPVKGLPYVAAAYRYRRPIEEGTIPVDLDQVILWQATSGVLLYSGDGIIVGPPVSTPMAGDFYSIAKIPVFEEGTRESHIPGLYGRIVYCKAIRRGKVIHPLGTFSGMVAVFANATVLEKRLMGFYMWRRKFKPTVRTVHTDAANLYFVQQLVPGEEYSQDYSFLSFVKHMEERFGKRSVDEWKYLLRKQGYMLLRHDHDRFVDEPTLCGIKHPSAVWAKICRSRQTRLQIDGPITESMQQTLLYRFRLNGLVAYWDTKGEYFTILDPFADNGVYRRITVQLEDAPNIIPFHIPSRQIDGYYFKSDGESVGDLVSWLSYEYGAAFYSNQKGSLNLHNRVEVLEDTLESDIVLEDLPVEASEFLRLLKGKCTLYKISSDFKFHKDHRGFMSLDLNRRTFYLVAELEEGNIAIDRNDWPYFEQALNAFS
jgi:hypothetical protein